MRKSERWLIFDDWVGHAVWLLLPALLVALVLSAAFHARVLALAFVLGAMLVIGLLWPWWQIWGVRGYLVLRQRRAQVGRPTEVSAEVRNRSFWPVAGLLVQAERGQILEGKAAWIPYIAPWRTAAVHWSIVPTHRGTFPQRPPRISTTFPFRFTRARRRLQVKGELLVWPRLANLDVLVGGDLQLAADLEASPRASGSTGEILGAREYRSGDSLRRIHWPQTARQDRLIVCELSTSASRGVHVVMNTDPAVQFSSGEHASLERILSIAASLADASIRQRRPVSLALSEDLVIEATDTASLHAMLDYLARWSSPETTAVPPGLRVPAAQFSAMQHQVFLLTTACQGRLNAVPAFGGDTASAVAIIVDDGSLPTPVAATDQYYSHTCVVPVYDELLAELSIPARFSPHVSG